MDPPSGPCFRVEDRSYWCNCTRLCNGILQPVSKNLFYKHKKHRDGDQGHRLGVGTPRTHGSAGPSSTSAPQPQPPPPPSPPSSPPNSEAGRSGSPGMGGLQNEHPPPGAANPDPSAGGPAPQQPEAPPPLPPDDPEVTAALEDHILAMDYIKALSTANPDDVESIDAALVRSLQHPAENLFDLDADPDLKLSIRLYMGVTLASQETYNTARQAILERWPECQILSFDQVRTRIQQITGVVPIPHDMCPNTCMAYTGPLATLTRCRVCNETRYDPNKSSASHNVPRRIFYTIPIGPQLQALYRSEESAAQMDYRKRATDEVFRKCVRDPNTGAAVFEADCFDDYLHGDDYIKAALGGKVKDEDIVLLLSTDGCQLYKNKQSDCWIFIWVIMNLPPSARYKKYYVVPGGFIPGPNNPKIFDSFTFPSLLHIVLLQKLGLPIWNAATKQVFVSKPFVLFGTADGPGLCYFSGLVGHTGYRCCRGYCPIKGRRFKDKSTRYYPAMYKPDDWVPPGSDHPDVDYQTLSTTQEEKEAEYVDMLKVVMRARNENQFKTARRITGISKPSIFQGMDPEHRLGIPGMFPSDTMHLKGLNVPDCIINLFRGALGSMDCDPSDNTATWTWAIFQDKDYWQAHGDEVESFRKYLPGSFDRPPRNIAKKINSGYKAREFLSYMYGYLPGLLYNVLPLPYWQNLCKLVQGCRLLLQHSVTKEELETAHRLLVEFCLEFEVYYVQRKANRLHFVKPCIHNLLHLALETKRCGPLPLFAQWTIERVIGYLGGEVNMPSNPYMNLSERGLNRAQLNALIAMAPQLRATKPQPKTSVDLGGGYTLLHPQATRKSTMGLEEKAALSRHRQTTFGTQPILESQTVTFYKWARVLLPTRQIARTHWKESLKSVDEPQRTARMVKVSFMEKEYIGEVRYFFQLTTEGTEEALAMVSLCGAPDAEILSLSSHALKVMAFKSGENLAVFNVTKIKSVVALLPFKQKDGSVFLFEDFGLDVAHLSSLDFSLEGDDLGL